MSFKDKLSKIITESSVFNGEEFITTMQTEDTILAEIVAAIPLHGVTYCQYEEGVLTVSTRKKSAVESFTQYLDDNDFVLNYDITAKVYNPLNGTVNQDDTLDFDLVIDNELIEYYIDVILNPSYIEYAPVYVDYDSDDDYLNDWDGDGDADPDDDQYSFEYSDDDFDGDGDNDSDDYRPVYGTVSPKEVPILLNIVDIKSHSPFGAFSATLHPKDESKFLVQCIYSSLPNPDDAQADVDLINSFMGDYEISDIFTIISNASYKTGDLKTTSAIYQTIDKKKDVLNIVEAFGDKSYIRYDLMLHEVQRVIKINFRGARRVKMQCAKGYKYDPARKVCVKIGGTELAISRLAHRQMARTKHSKGEGYLRKIVRKTNRAKKFRKLIGLQ